MKVLITGASGYLGARLVKYLAQKNRENELFLASRSGRCRWLQGLGEQVALNVEEVGKLSLPSGLDTIIHLAALNEIDCADTARALKVNVEGTWKLIESAAEQGVTRFVYASTIHVYGPLKGNLNELSLPVSRHPYGFTHYMGEQLFEYALQKYGISTACLRFSNIVGAPADKQVNRWTLLINDLCQQAVNTGKLTLRSPESLRDFITMTDACVAVEMAMTESLPEPTFSVMNISMVANTSVKEMAELVANRSSALLGKKIEIVFKKTSSSSASDEFRIENTKAKNWRWSPQSHFQDEIDQTLRLCMETK